MIKFMTRAALVGTLTLAMACGDDGDSKSNNSTNNNTTNTNNNTTNTNNNTTGTNNNTTGTNNNTTNTNNNTAGLQCQQANQDCVVGNATAAGFECLDAGTGPKCLRSCTPPADGDAYPCPSGQACGATEQGGATACIPSQCAGFQDFASCDAFGFPNGGNCFPTENDNFLCVPAGAKAEGVACAADSECAAGTLCTDVCTKICQNDAACTGEGERCIGDTDPDFLNTGAGLCQVGCDSYTTDQCPEGTGCFPVTTEDGVCVADRGPGQIGDSCNQTNGCTGGLVCFRLSSAPDGVCTALCNSGADTQAAADATCVGNGTQFCLDNTDTAAGEEPGATTGFCVEQCTAAEYGSDRCSADTYACRPFQGERHVCFPAGTIEVGQPCAGGDCVEGSYCLLTGSDDALPGTCTPYCDLAATNPNPNLVCGQGQSCQPIGDETFAFGLCGLACDTQIADTDCPANLQTCTIESGDTTGFCSASGALARGAACASPTDVNKCTAGNICANAANVGTALFTSVSQFIAELEQPGTCAQACELFGPADQCGAGKACVADFVTFGTSVGVCADLGTNMANTASNTACADPGKSCGPNAICVGVAANQNICLQTCQVGTDNLGCTAAGETCDALIEGADLGICQ
ncbi:MAG: hypothetical protein R3E66_15245 [bacterium]